MVDKIKGRQILTIGVWECHRTIQNMQKVEVWECHKVINSRLIAEVWEYLKMITTALEVGRVGRALDLKRVN